MDYEMTAVLIQLGFHSLHAVGKLEETMKKSRAPPACQSMAPNDFSHMLSRKNVLVQMESQNRKVARTQTSAHACTDTHTHGHTNTDTRTHAHMHA